MRTSTGDSPSTPTLSDPFRPPSPVGKGKGRASDPLPSPGFSLTQASAYRSPHFSTSSLGRAPGSDEPDEVWRGSKYVSGISSWSRSSPPPAVPPLPSGPGTDQAADDAPAASEVSARDDAVRLQTQRLAAEADRMGESSSSASSLSEREMDEGGLGADESTDLLPSHFVDAQASPVLSTANEGTPKSRRRSSGAFASIGRLSSRARRSHPSITSIASSPGPTPQRKSSLFVGPSSGPSTPTRAEQRSPAIERQASQTSRISSIEDRGDNSSYFTPEGTPLTTPNPGRYVDPESPLQLPSRSHATSPLVGSVTSAAEEADRKRMLRRVRAIRELVDTEWTYAQDLALARDVYMARAQGVAAQTIRAHLAASNMIEPPTPNTVHDLLSTSSQLGHRRRQSTTSSRFASSKGSPILDTSTGVPIFSPTDVRTVFINLPELAAFSADFAAAIDDARGSATDESRESTDDRIGHVFLQMVCPPLPDRTDATSSRVSPPSTRRTARATASPCSGSKSSSRRCRPTCANARRSATVSRTPGLRMPSWSSRFSVVSSTRYCSSRS